ncbi:ParB/RepB/Spo0J family partition protein [Aquicella lusitana]|uniref:ParB family chromosome partitioning protein n=1 Tax=Aquicella lusitana TaxID=254246 RepID=A0A370GFC4_9COXI|nr:ParB/RepB/Spo0J family partition protein [Aquicella lusitana]RDI41104.1 ParB family chromosome partitioning protein [Aquicella lusitana]VVC74714.1 putative chromosome-partitioning protein ParB [Aquicella lusitana]
MAKKKVFSIGTALSQGLEETIESAQNYSSELRVDVIPLKKIELDPTNPRDLALTMQDVQDGINDADKDKSRKLNELASLESMAHSIKTQGIINPIMVYKHGEQYRLVAGERRTLASILAGKSDIQAKILDGKPDQLKVGLLQWIENIERSDLTLWERINNLKMIVDAYAKSRNIQPTQITASDLGDLIGCVKSHAANYKTVLNADTELTQLIAENKIKNLEKAALISDIKEPDIREQAVNACIAGATLKQLKNLADHAKIKPIVIKQVEKRGRQSSSINFGMTKNTNVARAVIESLLANKSLAHLKSSFSNIDWSDHRLVAETFKQLLRTLEKVHS